MMSSSTGDHAAISTYREPSQYTSDDPPPPYPYDEEFPHALPSRLQTNNAPTPAHLDEETPTSTEINSGNIKYPSILEGYLAITTPDRSYDLGSTPNQKLFRLCTQRIPHESIEVLHIHNGTDSGSPILASAESQFCATTKEHVVITLFAVLGLQETEKEILMHRLKRSLGMYRATMEFIVEINGHLEKFQWRHSSGKEVQDISKYSSGWKLVRMEESNVIEGGGNASRQKGLASDGKEVVAVIAHTLSAKKEFTFAFMGSGLTGAMGELWETTALLSGIWQWWTAFG
ncbi:uncharacterized protein CTRU02_211471 [Colletotrichum truncatum]|uniref:Uncharacterized protein n=1 Tax=Colletotrichum truncatum TaxID=5467 RepID=A0ACC3YS48_COLTU|nr:uncharacterized protein CTRU02_02251 [Colletotrichum truncatum]KAF6799380.1 hypothetical protein CTRU02_02251 [Colletotrichum truncatum]